MTKKKLTYAELMGKAVPKSKAKAATPPDQPERPRDDDGIYPPDPITDNPPPALETRPKPPIHNPGEPVGPITVKPKKTKKE